MVARHSCKQPLGHIPTPEQQTHTAAIHGTRNCSQGRTTYRTPFSNPIAAIPIPSKAARVPRLGRDPLIITQFAPSACPALGCLASQDSFASTVHASQLIVPSPVLPQALAPHISFA